MKQRMGQDGIWRLLALSRPRPALLLLAAGLMLAGIGLEALKPWPLKLLVDDVLASSSPRPALIPWLVASTVVIFLLIQFARIAQAYLLAGIGARMSYSLGGAVFEKLGRLSLQLHARKSTGDLVRRTITDCSCVRELLLGVVIPIVSSLASLGIMFAVLWRLDALLAIIAISFALPLAGVIRCFARPMNERSLAQQDAEGELMSAAERTLSAIPVVQTFAAEPREDIRFVEHARRTLRAAMRSLAAQLQFKVGTGLVTAAGTATVMCIGGWRALDGRLTVGDLLVFLSYLASLYAPLETLTYVSWSYASASARGRRVLEILDSDEMVRQSPEARSIPASVGGATHTPDAIAIHFDRVSFGYEPGRPVLHKIELEIPAGRTVALMGPTGSGKSTLASLVARLYDPWQGAVRFNGADLRELVLSEVRRAVSVVPQDSLLLPVSVADNIAYGRPSASQREIIAAAEAANADEFITKLPSGYETVLGQRGSTLSGGQRQRIAIARALLKDAPILICDEPTSALDPHTEQLVLDAFRLLLRGRTCILIAHRMSTLRDANQVIVLNGGHIVEQGPPTRLWANEGGGIRELHKCVVGSPQNVRNSYSGNCLQNGSQEKPAEEPGLI